MQKSPELDKLIAAALLDMTYDIKGYLAEEVQTSIDKNLRSFVENLRVAVEVEGLTERSKGFELNMGEDYTVAVESWEDKMIWNAALASVKAKWDKLLNS